MKAIYLKTLLSGVVALGVNLSAEAQTSQSSSRSVGLIDPSTFGDDSIAHFAGYFDTGYAIPEGDGDEVFTAKFAPIVHYQYQDWLFFEAEGEFDFEDNGATEKNSALEYATLNFVVNDNLAIGVGKYLSPVGQFVQNLHPSWINKLPSIPLGFASGHHGAGAAPNNDFGVQARGGITTSENGRLNYALFVGNGPELKVEATEDGDLQVEGITLPAKIDDANSDKSTGLRLGFLPIPNLEIGVSFERADAAFSSIIEAHGDDGHGDEATDDHANEEGDDHAEEEGDDHAEEADDHADEEDDHGSPFVRDRDYQVWSLDFYYAPEQISNLVFRGEFVSTELGAGQEDEADHDLKRWEAWYAQASYYFADRKVEAVTRYGNFQPNGDSKSKQWAVGVNYLLKSNSVIKAAYEFNDSGDEDRLLFQYAYGF